MHQGLVLQSVDSFVHRKNHYPLDDCLQTNLAIRWIVIYLVDNVIRPLNNWVGFDKLGDLCEMLLRALSLLRL